jgi:hypothetical protein
MPGIHLEAEGGNGDGILTVIDQRLRDDRRGQYRTLAAATVNSDLVYLVPQANCSKARPNFKLD